MTPDEYAASMVASLAFWDASRPRSMQRELGVSSIGLCHTQAAFVIAGLEPTDAPEGRQALMGTAAHEVIGAARAAYNPGLLLETELTVALPSGMTVVGHADEIDPDEPGVTDYKTLPADSDMVALRRTGSSEQQRFQRHLYYLGAHQAGLVPAEGVVRNVWIDRSGQCVDPYVEQEPFSMDVVRQADMWLTDVRYAVDHGEETPKDKHYEWCKRFCEFFSHCRQNDHPDLLVSDPELVRAARLTLQGRLMAAEGKALEESARRVLEVLQPDPGGDVQAFLLDDVRVRWSWVNSERTTKGGYHKLAVEEAVA